MGLRKVQVNQVKFYQGVEIGPTSQGAKLQAWWGLNWRKALTQWMDGSGSSLVSYGDFSHGECEEWIPLT